VVATNRVRRGFVVAAALALAAQLAATPALDAQPLESAGATPFLAPDHWAAAAMRRLASANALPPGFDTGARSLRVAEAAHAFALAAAGDGPTNGLAAAYLDRLAEEFGAWTAPRSAAWALRLDGDAGYLGTDGLVRAGVGYENVDDWTGTEPIPDEAGAAARVALGATFGGHVAALVAPALVAGEATLADAQLVAEAGPLGVWLGRRTPGYGVGRGGTVVLSGSRSLDGGGLYLAEPLTLPWILRALGPIRFETFLSRIENGDRITDPWLWGARGSFSPHRRLDFGMNRGAMFGGDGNTPVTARNVLLMLVGEHVDAAQEDERGEFANQLLSADVRWRPPLGTLPLELYAEWGLDDSSGGYWRSPAVIAGIHLAALPGAEGLSIGVERTSFAAGSFKNTMWYRSWSLRGGWTDDRLPLGHPLGGHGTEWLVYGAADVLAARLRVDAGVARRDRAAENLLAPERTGTSTALSLDVAWRAARWLDLSAGVRHEDGTAGWTASRIVTAVRAWLPAGASAGTRAPTSRPTGGPRSVR
jgi:Capsule assembly protein Wzi